ncbi:glycosyltransferase [uncultured Clostridium sp.]|uniref:glycosyltransferase n=1 Tax=uncultured Clostridium sp. TaxID=59620 RepID=UPI0025E3C514|nr:glycosyltransferase [uncultured Clostridium sp.]
MKVLQINSVCGRGSTGKIAVDLYNLLEEQGESCIIAYGRGEPLKDIKTIKIGNSLNNYYHYYKTKIFDEHGFASKKSTENFIKEIKKYNPDVIHLHNIHGYYLNIEILFNYLRESNKPVIWTLHDCWPFTGHCCYFDYINCEKWQDSCYNCEQKNEYPSSILFDKSRVNYEKKRRIFTSLDDLTIVTPSNWLAELTKKSFLKKYNIYVINNGINAEIFKFTKSNFRKNNKLEDKIILLGVANVWDYRKGLKYFLELEKILDKKYKIVLVGLDKKTEKNISKNILVINHTNSQKELAEIYSAADIFINPTLEDNYPTTNLEALACNTKVITFNTGGCMETVKNSSSKVLNKKTLEELYKSIIELSNENTKFYSDEKYDKNIRFKKYIDLYKKCI